METTHANEGWKRIFVFLSLTIALTSIFWILFYKTNGGDGKYVIGMMWCPGIAGLITTKIFRRGIADMGWKWTMRYQLWSYFLPLIYGLVAYIFLWVTGLAGFYDKEYLQSIAPEYGFGFLPDALQLILFLVIMGLMYFPVSCASALGEELGWRGFLTPGLFKLTGYTKTSFIVGMVWSMWHWPLFFAYPSRTNVWYELTCFTTMVIGITFIYTWFRMKSGSLWTGVFLHASHNLFILMVFGPLSFDSGNTAWYSGETGIVLAVVSILVGFYFWLKRGELKLSEFFPSNPGAG